MKLNDELISAYFGCFHSFFLGYFHVLSLYQWVALRPPMFQAAGHIEAGAKKVIISAPGKGDLKTLVAW